MVLFIDTETTGKYDFKKTLAHPSQPDLVQVAVILDDGSRQTVASIDLIAVPPTHRISPEATQVHGITDDKANAYGISLAVIAQLLENLLARAEVIVAHNIEFDLSVLRTAYHRVSKRSLALESTRRFCTMKMSMDILKLPGPYDDYKWPTLMEAYKVLVDGKGFSGAHDAMIDVKACRKVYYAIMDRKGRK